MTLGNRTYTGSQRITRALVTTVHQDGIHFGQVVEIKSEGMATAIRPNGASETYTGPVATDEAIAWLLNTTATKKVWELMDEVAV